MTGTTFAIFCIVSLKIFHSACDTHHAAQAQKRLMAGRAVPTRKYPRTGQQRETCCPKARASSHPLAESVQRLTDILTAHVWVSLCNKGGTRTRAQHRAGGTRAAQTSSQHPCSCQACGVQTNTLQRTRSPSSTIHR